MKNNRSLNLIILAALSLNAIPASLATASSPLALGKAKLQQGQVQAAVKLLEEATAKEPTNCEAHLCLGKAYIKMKDIPHAKAQFRTAVRVGHGSIAAQQANQALMNLPHNFISPKTGAGTRLIASALGISGHVRGADGIVDKPTVIDFYASWCHPCKLLEPAIDKLKVAYGDKINFMRVNVDDPNSEQIIDQYSVSPIPTIIYLNKDGEVVTYTIGYSGDTVLNKGIEKILSTNGANSTN